MPVITPTGGGGGGGGGAVIFTTDLTTDPNTFLLPALDEDFGMVAPVFVSLIIKSVVSNGEAWGAGVGQIAAALPRLGSNWQGQRDSTPVVLGWTTLADVWNVINANTNDTFDTVGQYGAFTTVIPQCMRINPATGFGVYQDGGNGPLYAGPNHPTITVTVTIERLT